MSRVILLSINKDVILLMGYVLRYIVCGAYLLIGHPTLISPKVLAQLVMS